MKKTFSLFLVVGLNVVYMPLTVKADADSQCYLCFANNIASAYCMYGTDSPNGKCCPPGTSDDCAKSQYFCTDKISNAFSYQKYAFCSFDKKRCGTERRTLFAKYVP